MDSCLPFEELIPPPSHAALVGRPITVPLLIQRVSMRPRRGQPLAASLPNKGTQRWKGQEWVILVKVLQREGLFFPTTSFFPKSNYSVLYTRIFNVFTKNSFFLELARDGWVAWNQTPRWYIWKKDAKTPASSVSISNQVKWSELAKRKNEA